MRRIYLDNNATTELAPEVLHVMIEELKSGPANPSSVHSYGQEARNRLTKARRACATFMEVQPSELIFTSCGTEGINTLLRGLFQTYKGIHIISSTVEHSAVYKTLLFLQGLGADVTFLEVGSYGAVTTQQINENIRPNTKLIVLMAVNNETGVKTDLAEIGAIANRENIPFIVDGVALMGKERVVIPDGVSAMCFSGHKFHAPKGIGMLYIRKSLKFTPIMTGGGQEYERRGGTENLAGIMGLTEALRLINICQNQATSHMIRLQERFEKGLLQIKDVTINGQGPRVANTTNIAFHGIEGESLLIALDLAGIAASHGSACSSGSLEPSRVLLNMGLSKSIASSSIRFSTSRYTTLEEIDQCVEIISDVVRKQRNSLS